MRTQRIFGRKELGVDDFFAKGKVLKFKIIVFGFRFIEFEFKFEFEWFVTFLFIFQNDFDTQVLKFQQLQNHPP